MEQRTVEWNDFRGPRITGSRLGDVLARPDTKRYRYYMEDIVDALMGFKKFPKDEPWFDHGNEWEDEAIGLYEWEENVTVERIGVLVHPKYDFISCSPDGQIGDFAGLEVKCHKSLKEYLKSVRAGIPTQHIPQVQGYLWISGRPYCDFVSYYRNFDKTKRLINVHPVYSDLKYHRRLENACLNFWGKIQDKIKLVALDMPS